MIGSLRKQAGQAGRKTRVQNVSTEQTVRAGPAYLHGILFSNANAGAQSLTLTDGETVLNVLRLAATSTVYVPCGFPVATSLKVTPSHADVDALLIYD